MSEFIKATVSDIHGGRETWRVRVMLMLPAFFIAIGFGIAHLR